MVVSRQFNYNISVRGYSIFYSKKASKIKACGVSQTPIVFYVNGGEALILPKESFHDYFMPVMKLIAENLTRDKIYIR